MFKFGVDIITLFTNTVDTKMSIKNILTAEHLYKLAEIEGVLLKI